MDTAPVTGDDIAEGIVVTVFWVWAWWSIVSKIGYRGVSRWVWLGGLCVPALTAMFVFPTDIAAVPVSERAGFDEVSSPAELAVVLGTLMSSIAVIATFSLLLLPWPIYKELRKLREQVAIQSVKPIQEFTGDTEIDLLQAKLNQLREKRRREKL